METRTMTRAHHITSFYYKNNGYEIVRDEEGFYWAFDKKFIKDGRLTKQFNGITGHRNDSLKKTMMAVANEVDIREWDSEHPVEDDLCMERILAMKEIIENNMQRYAE